MSDTDNDKPKLGMRQPLGLKRTVETGKVKQSFSHGRSNTVVVEVKRRRVLGPNAGGPAEAPVVEEAQAPTPAPAPAAPVARTPAAPQLSAQERQTQLLREAEEQRMGALEEARRREDAQRQAAVEDEKRRVEEKGKVVAPPPAPAEVPA
uniref:translation initiation factor IF-2 associated domain-containing protein n=1 Tax=Sphingomonas asaccharolytica TaxID=40681 RepID=UPI000B065C9D